MFTVHTHTFEMLVEKQSKFIAHLMPYSQYKSTLEKLKQEHPKARHFVTAFRYMNEFDQIVEGSSDDGEPRGTSGKPTLSVLQGNDLIDIAVITVRYFGGTKLGTGGLVRAYSTATNLVVQEEKLHIYKKLKKITIHCNYTNIGKVEYLFVQHNITVENKEFDASGVQMILIGSSEDLRHFISQADRLVLLK
ncbi:MAG: YigZ family protein [Epsilonproteobacteria bacterium]|nr:MAG: YigZ family protein [Campylobacterota bacterium]